MSQSDDYDKEQARLKEANSTGKEELEDLPEIEEPVVDPVIYRDVESLLYRGFVVSYGNIGGVRVVWKSLNHHEFDLLSLIYGDDQRDPSFQHAFLCRSFFAVGGNIALGKSDEIGDLLPKLPESIKKDIFQSLQSVNERAYRATHLVEAYAMEKISRWRWSQVRGLDLTLPSLTGIPGTESLGHNWAQLIWRALNSTEDMVEALENSWDHAKFIGSCFTKLDRVYNSDVKRRRDTKIARIRRKEEVIRQVILLEPEEQAKRSAVYGQVRVARDASDLAREVSKQLRGEKDFHDIIVEAAMEHQRGIIAAQETQREELRKQAEASFDGNNYSTVIDLGSVLTPQEMRKKMQESAKDTALRPATPEADTDEKEKRNRRYGLLPGQKP